MFINVSIEGTDMEIIQSSPQVAIFHGARHPGPITAHTNLHISQDNYQSNLRSGRRRASERDEIFQKFA